MHLTPWGRSMFSARHAMQRNLRTKQRHTLAAATVWCCLLALGGAAQTRDSGQVDTLSLEQAVSEALDHNLGLLAERYNLTIAEARIVTACLRPNPVLTLDADHLDLLGTGFNINTNNGGPA